MYDDFSDLDFIIETHYESLDDMDTSYDLDDEYRDSCDYQELAYRHYAWYNVNYGHITIMASIMTVAHKKHVRVILDMYVYDDIEIPENQETWAEILGLEGDEEVSFHIKDDSYTS